MKKPSYISRIKGMHGADLFFTQSTKTPYKSSQRTSRNVRFVAREDILVVPVSNVAAPNAALRKA